MSLTAQLNEDIKTAMKAKDPIRLEALRAVKKEVIEAKTAKAGIDDLADEDVISIISKMVKQRKDRNNFV